MLRSAGRPNEEHFAPVFARLQPQFRVRLTATHSHVLDIGCCRGKLWRKFAQNFKELRTVKILLVIETPEDDDIHWVRITRALDLYACKVRANNCASLQKSYPALDRIGLTAGPNVLDCGLGVSITEARIDSKCFKYQVFGCLHRHFPLAARAWSALVL